jgi:hypothetical protein
MFGFGFCWYGPYQYYWYALLEHLMPIKTTANFIAKVWRPGGGKENRGYRLFLMLGSNTCCHA